MNKYAYLMVSILSMNTTVIAQEMNEHRQMVEMPSEIKQMFLKNMRVHMESLDQIIAALAENNLNEAAKVAETTMGAGHRKGKQRQCDSGEGSKAHKHKHAGQKGKGFGKYMPTEMKAMGMQLHVAADDFAVVARQGDIGEAYKALRQVSSSCVACHQSFGIK